MKKTWSVILTMVLFAGLLAGCGEDKTGTAGDSSDKKRIVLVTPEEIGVNPFFALMDEGLKKAEADLGVEIKTI